MKLSLSRKKNTFSYAPGQEIRFSSGSFGWETEDESVKKEYLYYLKFTPFKNYLIKYKVKKIYKIRFTFSVI